MDAQAYLKIEVNGREEINAAEGDGPVNALDLALRKTLALFLSQRQPTMRLQDFKVRVLNLQGTASRVRVSIESTDGIHLWKTVGVHNNIILASLRALIDSVDYMLTKYVPAGRNSDRARVSVTLVILFFFVCSLPDIFPASA